MTTMINKRITPLPGFIAMLLGLALVAAPPAEAMQFPTIPQIEKQIADLKKHMERCELEVAGLDAKISVLRKRGTIEADIQAIRLESELEKYSKCLAEGQQRLDFLKALLERETKRLASSKLPEERRHLDRMKQMLQSDLSEITRKIAELRRRESACRSAIQELEKKR